LVDSPQKKPNSMLSDPSSPAGAVLRHARTPTLMPARAPQLIGALVFVLGVLVMSGWVLHVQPLVQILPGLIAMVFNTALCFALAGLALATRSVLLRRALAGVLAVFAALVWSQDFFRIDLGLDQLIVGVFFPDTSPFPGRMAPQTCICFLLAAFTLASLTFPYRRWLSLLTQTVTIVIGIAGFISLIGYSLQLELIYSWYRYTRMAVHTAGGFTVLALGLWLAWYRMTIEAGAFDEHEDQRINFIGGALIIIVAVVAGISGFSLLARHTERIALHALTIELDAQLRALDNALNERARDVEWIARLPALRERLADVAADPKNAAGLQEWLSTLIAGDVAAINVYSSQGSLIASAGAPWRSAEIDIKASPQVRLLWRDGARVRVSSRLTGADRAALGSIEVELDLPLVAEMIRSTAKVSATGDLRICGDLDDASMQCLPTRLEPRAVSAAPRVMRSVELPMSLALRGESGARVFLNYRERNSVGAYGRLSDSGVALVMQQETEDTYAAIRRPLRTLMICLVLLVSAAIVMLRWQVAPLVRKTMAAKADAAANATRVASIMNSVPDGIITIDRAGNIVEANPAVSALFGYAKEELLGRNVMVLMPQSMRAAHEAGHRRFMATGERKLVGRGSVEVPALRKDGSEFVMQLSLTELTLDTQRFIVGIMRDVTERKAAERLKDEFISVVSHELRTPLTSISGSLGLMAAGAGGELPPKASRLVQIANQNSERLTRLINDILDLEKADGGKLQLTIVPQSVRSIVEHAIEANQPYVQRFGVQLVLDPSSEEGVVAVDRDRLAQVLTNIISNAAKFSPHGENVRVRVVAGETAMRIEVCDRGSGIPESFRPRIFQKFAQADSSDKRAKGGTGLGLSIAKSLIESMGGSIGYESSSAGTTFHVTVPRAAEALPREHVA
jgi:PAS domain S-box-containing protein